MYGLTRDDLRFLRDYVNQFGGTENTPFEGMAISTEEYLRDWEKNKEFLFHAFGDKLIVEENVTFEASRDIILSSMEDMFTLSEDRLYDNVIQKIIFMLEVVLLDGKEYYVSGAPQAEAQYVREVRFALNNIDNYVDNRIEDGYKYQGNRKDIKIPNIYPGQKPFKLIHNILNAFEPAAREKDSGIFDDEFFITLKRWIEKFRIKHSQILNNTSISGNLCLSIAPIDFLTASDNDYNWDSCMTWTRNTPGEYRVGVVEMMNSPIVVIAYLAGDRPYYPLDDNRTCSNKKWREFFIVTRDIISGIRAYPYAAPGLDTIILKKLAKILENAGYPAYGEVQEDKNPLLPLGPVSFDTYMMYNDTQYHDSSYVVSTDPTDKYWNSAAGEYHINYSSKAICPVCGNPFTRNDSEADIIVCGQCESLCRCEECGDRLSDDDGFDIGGYRYCCNCASECVFCEEAYTNDELERVTVRTQITRKDDGTVKFDNDCVSVCPDCFCEVLPYIRKTTNTVSEPENGLYLNYGDFVFSSELPEKYASALRDNARRWWNPNWEINGVVDIPNQEPLEKIS